MKRVALAVGVLAAAAAAGCYWPRSHAPEVLRLPGTVEVQEVRLGSKAGGRVAAVNVREGDVAKAGQVLVTFEAPELTARRDQMKAKLASAVAALDRAKAGPLPEEVAEARAAADAAAARLDKLVAGARDEQKQQARAEAAAAKAEFRQAEDEAARAEAARRVAASDREYVVAVTNRDRARGRADSAAAALDLLRNGTRYEEVAEARAEHERFQARYQLLRRGTRDEDKAAAAAAVADARAALAEAEANLREAAVVAPEACVVEVLSVRAGDLVPAGQPAVRALRADDLWVKAFVPATDLGKLKLGQAVEVTVDSHPGVRFPGEVVQIAAVSEFTPRNVQSPDERRHQVFAVKVRVADPNGVFKSGMAADVFLPVGQ